MNLYDFDKTIYNGESSSRFYFFYLFRHLYLFWHLFVVAFWGVVYLCHGISLSGFKEHFLSIFRYSRDLSLDVSRFWDKEEKRIFEYYLQKRRENDVICSASPAFLIAEIMSRINPTATIICSKIDNKTLRFVDGEKNNKGQNKVTNLNRLGFTTFDNGYSDSNSDIPMLSLCKNKYKVIKGKIEPFDEKYFK